MSIVDSEKNYQRPCCAMLKAQARSWRSLVDPNVCVELLDCMANNCVLLKEAGYSRVNVDEQSGQCYLLVDPTTTRQILNEVSETITLEGLIDYYALLNKVESCIAKNPLRQEIADNHALLLATIRTGEAKFGTVPPTIEKNPTQSPELLDNPKRFLDQPRLENSTQYDGVPPSQTAIPNDSSNASEQINRLQNQHHPKPAFNPRPQH